MELDSGIPLQLATKVPIMITFAVVDKDGDPNNVKLQPCLRIVNASCSMHLGYLHSWWARCAQISYLVHLLGPKSHVCPLSLNWIFSVVSV